MPSLQSNTCRFILRKALNFPGGCHAISPTSYVFVNFLKTYSSNQFIIKNWHTSPEGLRPCQFYYFKILVRLFLLHAQQNRQRGRFGAGRIEIRRKGTRRFEETMECVAGRTDEKHNGMEWMQCNACHGDYRTSMQTARLLSWISALWPLSLVDRTWSRSSADLIQPFIFFCKLVPESGIGFVVPCLGNRFFGSNNSINLWVGYIERKQVA